MTTLRLNGGLELKRKRQKRSVYSSGLRVYVDRGYRSTDERVKEPPMVQRVMLTLAMHRLLQRQKILRPDLQPTHRTLLRWGESGGTGLPNPEAEIRETHYDPLPPDIHEKVDDIVSASPWDLFARKVYRTNLTNEQLLTELGLKRTQFYTDWNSSLWYFRGHFEAQRVYG
jgi:hypothetical protein